MLIDICLSPDQIRALGYQSRSKSDLLVTFRLQETGYWRAFMPGPDQGLQIQRPMVVCTVGNRHPGVEADYYLANKVDPGQSAYDLVYGRMAQLCRFSPKVEIDLIYNGLTECTLAAVFALIAHRMTFKVLRFDATYKGYVPLDLSRFHTHYRHM